MESLGAEPPSWAAGYIGLPFKDCGREADGLDCWGLALLVLAERGGCRDLPDFRTKYTSSRDRALPEIFRAEMALWRRVEVPHLLDVAVLRICGAPRHVGVMVARQRILTIDRSTASCLERIDTPRWAGRLEGFYRHADL